MTSHGNRWMKYAAIAAATVLLAAHTGAAASAVQAPGAGLEGNARDLFVTAGKSVIIDSPATIVRVAVANGEIAEAVAVDPHQVLVNGKAAGQTSLIVWQATGNRLFFDLTVRSNRLELVQQELRRALPGQNVTMTYEDNTVFLKGTVKNLAAARRAAAIAGTLGKVVNLLYVDVPSTESQVLLKVRFANVDRSASTELALNVFSTGAANTVGAITTQQFNGPQMDIRNHQTNVTLTDALNLFVFRPDLNLGATIKALQNRNLLEILAEPNVLAINGKPASFLAGGEFPYPTLQGGGAGLGAVTIQFREFGVRINFLPVITPRGTIRLEVTPEVSSLDFANGLVFQGFTIPALSTRRVQTEIELEDGQSFAIGGLLDNRVSEILSKIPGIGDIPWLGKLFRSRALQKNNTELLVLVTPELVRPIPAGRPRPEVAMPAPFLKGTAAAAPQTPGMSVTGPVPVKAPEQPIPVEDLIESMKPKSAQPSAQQGQYPIQFVPVQAVPAEPPASPAAPQGEASAPATAGSTAKGGQ